MLQDSENKGTREFGLVTPTPALYLCRCVVICEMLYYIKTCYIVNQRINKPGFRKFEKHQLNHSGEIKSIRFVDIAYKYVSNFV